MSEEKMERVYLREHRNKVLCLICEKVNIEIGKKFLYDHY